MDILYQDSRIIVVIKPVGVISSDVPELLRRQLGTDCFRTVHRLDAQVSGLMVLARSARAASILSEEMAAHRFFKEYMAVVHGAPPASGTMSDLLGRDKQRRITYVADTPGKEVRPAVLDYRVLERRENLSLVSICLHTGRTHQIRVQFASRGFPLAGDRKYGLPEDRCTIALWSHRLSFLHPETNETVTFIAPPPLTDPWDTFSSLEFS